MKSSEIVQGEVYEFKIGFSARTKGKFLGRGGKGRRTYVFEVLRRDGKTFEYAVRGSDIYRVLTPEEARDYVRIGPEEWAEPGVRP